MRILECLAEPSPLGSGKRSRSARLNSVGPILARAAPRAGVSDLSRAVQRVLPIYQGP